MTDAIILVIALALAFPAGVWFGVRIGQLREKDRLAFVVRRRVAFLREEIREGRMTLTEAQEVLVEDIVNNYRKKK